MIINYEFKRGDTNFLKKFKVTDKDGIEITLSDTDNVYFTMKNKDGEAVIRKNVTNGIQLLDDGYYRIVLDPTDTSKLKVCKYNYDIELNLNTTPLYVKTIIEGTIKLKKDITTEEDRV